MKKYVKPELFYEQFELSQHIADCAWELTAESSDTCAAKADQDYLPGFPNLFTEANGNCVFVPGVNYQDYCYHDGVQGVNVFKS